MTDATLLELQQAAGGRLAAERPAGGPAVSDFGDPAAEYQAARSDAALFDLSDRTQIELTGGDRARFLHNFCTNDVQALEPGTGCEAFITSPKGRIVAHVFVFAAFDSIWLETVPAAAPQVIAHLDRYLITDDVALQDRTGDCGELFVSGLQAAGRLAAADIDLPALEPYGHAKVESLDHPLFARRVDLLAAPGFLLSVPRDNLPDLWRRLSDAGIRPAGSAAFHALRIEAGMPLHGVDIGEDNLAQEAGRTRQAISFQKGCYLGQEPIARIDALGHVNRELRGLRLEPGPPPQPGAAVSAAGQEIGRVSSSAHSYADQRPVALAVLRSKFTAAGTAVEVETGGKAVAATVFWPGNE